MHDLLWNGFGIEIAIQLSKLQGRYTTSVQHTTNLLANLSIVKPALSLSLSFVVRLSGEINGQIHERVHLQYYSRSWADLRLNTRRQPEFALHGSDYIIKWPLSASGFEFQAFVENLSSLQDFALVIKSRWFHTHNKGKFQKSFHKMNKNDSSLPRSDHVNWLPWVSCLLLAFYLISLYNLNPQSI